MLSTILSFIGGGALSLVGLLLGLLPTVNISSLPIAMPTEVTGVLGMLNVFIPFGDLITIITYWATLVLALNVFYIVKSIFDKVSK